MTCQFLHGEGPPLGPLSSGTEMLEDDVRMKDALQMKLSINTGGFVDLKKKSKSFIEGPMPPPLSPLQEQVPLTTPDLNFIKKPSFVPPANNYIPGFVKATGKQALVELAEKLKTVKHSTTGAIVEEGIIPTGDEYSENLHFLVEKTLAKGSFGTGELSIDSETGKRFFRKKMKLESFRSSEVIVPVNLNHENVTKIYGLIQREESEDHTPVELLIEPAGMALNTYVYNNEITTTKIWHITKQAMAGLNHMHLYGMIHFDIKPENLCVQDSGNKILTKITDFGSAKLPHEAIEFVGWTPEYMARETSQLFLQKRGYNFPTVICESDVTGKVDVNAMGLVVMYLYEKVHVLQRLITNGKSSYADLSIKDRMDLQVDLMKMLAGDPDFIKRVIPDKCDIDMRELFGYMTEYDHGRRYSAQQVIDFIDEREKRLAAVYWECKQKYLQPSQEKTSLFGQEQVNLMPHTIGVEIPDIAYNCMEADNGPIKLHTKDKLRQKLKPYPGKGKGKMVKEETPMQELKRIQAASKTMDVDYQPPTPVTDVSLSMAKMSMQRVVHHTTESNAPVTQPMAEDNQLHVSATPGTGLTFHTQPTSCQQPRTPQIPLQTRTGQSVAGYGSNRVSVLPPQNHVVASTSGSNTAIKRNHVASTSGWNSPVKVNPSTQKALLLALTQGKLQIAMSEKGPIIVKVTNEDAAPTATTRVENTATPAPTRRGVTPFMPASPPESTHTEPNFHEDNYIGEDKGKVPDFLKLGMFP